MQTFVVRIWAPPSAEGEGGFTLRGVVEHLGSGQSQTFTNEDGLLAFLRAWRWEHELTAGREAGGSP